MISVISVVVITAGAIAFIEYRRQIISYLTHWKGGPSSTEPYLPFPEQPNFHIAAAGDTGDAGSRLDSTGVAIERIGEQYPFDALLLLGDLVYPSGDPSKLQSLVDEPFAGVLDQGAELLAILGNHDVKSDQGDQIMHDLGMPGRYWARTFGEVLVVGLDSTEMDDAAQLTFLESTLANSEANWKIVALHHPPYSAGYQGSSKDARRTFSPIFERYGVQLVLSGHDHDYQRSEPINGVTYVVSGAGSGTRRTGEDDFTAVAYSFIHFTDVAVFDDQLVIRAVDTAGRVADEATIMLGSVPSD